MLLLPNCANKIGKEQKGCKDSLIEFDHNYLEDEGHGPNTEFTKDLLNVFITKTKNFDQKRCADVIKVLNKSINLQNKDSEKRGQELFEIWFQAERALNNEA